MSIKILEPATDLEPYIKQYWGIENVLPKNEKHIHRVIPSGLPELTLYIDHLPKVLNNKKDFENNFILNGHHRQFYDLQIENKLSVFSVVFQPQGLMAFFNLPIIELFNQSRPLKYINTKLEQEILPRLTNEQLFENRVLIIEKYFIDLLKQEYNRFEFERINHAINIIRQTKGKVSIENLASETCLSRKQFERKFSDLIGTTPNIYLRTIRLQLSLFLKSKYSALNITDLAYESGYYDQAHYINEFKLFTGLTPKKYFDNNPSYSDYFE